MRLIEVTARDYEITGVEVAATAWFTVTPNDSRLREPACCRLSAVRFQGIGPDRGGRLPYVVGTAGAVSLSVCTVREILGIRDT